jgi:hypothetical protein
MGAMMVVVAGLLAVEANRRSRRSRAMPRAAKRFGMAYSDVDRFNTTAVAFPLFREGDGRVVENLMWHETGPRVCSTTATTPRTARAAAWPST